jgi:hypothetical protein
MAKQKQQKPLTPAFYESRVNSILGLVAQLSSLGEGLSREDGSEEDGEDFDLSMSEVLEEVEQVASEVVVKTRLLRAGLNNRPKVPSQMAGRAPIQLAVGDDEDEEEEQDESADEPVALDPPAPATPTG